MCQKAVIKADLRNIRFSSAFVRFFYVFASPQKSMCFFDRIFISQYNTHEEECYLLIKIFKNFGYER